MAARTLPNLGLKAFFDVGEDGWDDEMSLNLLTLSVLTQGNVIDKVAATPGSPTDGDVYLFDETHATEPNKVAIRDNGAWVYVAPVEGWLIYNKTANYYERFNGTVWAELATGGGGGALDDLSDVDTTTVAPTDGQGLVYDSADSTWKPGTIAGGGGGGGAPLIGDDIAAGGSNVLTVTAIPANFDHLRVYITGRSDDAGSGSDIAKVTFNTDSGASYSYERWNSFGAATSGSANFLDIANVVKNGASAGRFDSVSFDVMDYASITSSRQTLGLMGTTDGSSRIPQFAVGWWQNTTDPITSVEVTLTDGDWVAGSRLSVVGIGGAGSSGGGGGGEPSIFDKVLHARGTALNAAYGNGDSVDTVIVSGDMRALVYDLYTDSGTAINATNATVTVPAGKIAVLLYYEANDNVKVNPSYYRHRLRNTTAATEIDPTGGAVSDAGWSSPDGANSAIHYPVKVGDAGDVLVMQAWSAGDGSYRTVAGSCVIAFADSTTGAWDLPAGGGGGSSGPAAPISYTASHTLVIGDAEGYLYFTNSASATVAVPPEASVAFPIGTVIYLESAGTGALDIAAGSGVTVNSRGAALTMAGQYAAAQLKKVASDTWTVLGDVS